MRVHCCRNPRSKHGPDRTGNSRDGTRRPQLTEGPFESRCGPSYPQTQSVRSKILHRWVAASKPGAPSSRSDLRCDDLFERVRSPPTSRAGPDSITSLPVVNTRRCYLRTGFVSPHRYLMRCRPADSRPACQLRRCRQTIVKPQAIAANSDNSVIHAPTATDEGR